MNKNRVFLTVFIIVLFLSSSLLTGCIFFQPKGRLSGTVVFVHSPSSVQTWLQEPGKSYVQAYFMFPSDFASDIIFGIDQELIEGVNDPIHFAGADWMALVGLTREGISNIPVGTSESLNGTPSDASVWEFIDLGVELQPDTWYVMKETADFQSQRFDSFTLTGPGVNVTVDLSKYYVDYPNYISIDNRSLTYYVYAIRMYPYVQPGSTIIYFDDVEAGIELNSGYETVLTDGFETQLNIPDIPITLPLSPLSDIQEYYWYKENEDAMVTIVNDYAHTGMYSCLCNATLNGLSRTNMMKSVFTHYLELARI